MTTTERKKKKLPTFQYLPKSRAKRLKKSWVEDHKIRSKWKAQKKREGLTNQTFPPVEDASSHADNETSADSESESEPAPDMSPMPHDKPSLRDLRKTAYAPQPAVTQKSDSSRRKAAPTQRRNNPRGKGVRRETGQPNMKLRMDVLLEKIKRDFA